jgi:predicted AAA+ superfamily ATPase
MLERNILRFFHQWMQKERRKPLVIRGARQVGKTFAVNLFAGRHFKNVISLNLEKEENLAMFRRVLAIPELIQLIELRTGTKIIPGVTLLFLDEIQNSPTAMTQLRYFFEEMPQLHVMAAGSLLEVKMKKEGFSFPVGRVEYCYMFPLRFDEFLGAKGDQEALDYLNGLAVHSGVPEEIHRVLMKKYREYMVVGGMPEVVAEYMEQSSFIALDTIYESILTGYKDDVYKYASEAKARYLQHVIEHSPGYAGKMIKYDNFAESAFRSREMKEAFDTVEKAMILKRIHPSPSTRIPLTGNLRKSPKLIFLDSGLVHYDLGVRDVILTANDISDVYSGQMAEQMVGQTLSALTCGRQFDFAYWYRDKRGATAEVDFLIQIKNKVIPLEVKSGKAGTLKSLHQFMSAAPHDIALRIYSGNLNIRQVDSPHGSTYKLISLPFYLLHRLDTLLAPLV